MDGLNIFDAANRFGSQPALIFKNKTYSFVELAQRCRSLCTHLQELPVDKPFAFVAHNNLTTLLTIYSAMSTQRTFVPLHSKSTDSERDRLAKNNAIGQIVPQEVLSKWIDTTPISAAPFDAQTVEPNIPISILFTSGTQGPPKGVVLHASSFIASANASRQHLKWDKNDKWILTLPLCHIGGLSIITRCLLDGKCVILLERYDVPDIWAAIKHHQATMLSVVPTTLLQLLDEDRENFLSRLRVILLGGAAAPSALLERCQSAKLNVHITYGMTETCSQIATQEHSKIQPETGDNTIALPILPGVTVAIIDTSGIACTRMHPGRIQISGKVVMAGYTNDSPCDGTFLSNDTGYVDSHGHLHVIGRSDSMIITGGENVHPKEVENKLCEYPGVCEAIVFGIPDNTYGQIVAAAIFVDPKKCSKKPLSDWIQTAFSGHKKPRKLAFFDQSEIPLLATGKLDRQLILSRSHHKLSKL